MGRPLPPPHPVARQSFVRRRRGLGPREVAAMMGDLLISSGPERQHGHCDHRRGAARRRRSGAGKSRLTMHGTLLVWSFRLRMFQFQTMPKTFAPSQAPGVGWLPFAFATHRNHDLRNRPTIEPMSSRRQLTTDIFYQGRNQEPNQNRKELTGTRDIESITSRSCSPEVRRRRGELGRLETLNWPPWTGWLNL